MNLDDDDLRALFAEHAKGQSRFTRRMAIAMAAMDDTPPRSLVLRLERMALLRPGSWDWFARNGGITRSHVSQARRSTRPEVQASSESPLSG